jgi:3-deoxy-manno-octulosonate cytidylyltransferase (CMP-KDO synthetase)
MSKILCCIPARLASTRLPNKPLLKINGKTIINLVYEQVLKVNYNLDVIVLTDCDEIKNEVESFGGNVAIITEDCLNGSERIITFLKNNNITSYEIILNVQGDEPFINPKDIEMAIENYFVKISPSLVCSTLYYETMDKEEVDSRSRGKLVLNKNSDIMYCSRNIIPATKKNMYNPKMVYRIHVGIFVFKYSYLINEYMKENTYLQLQEDIEWLKIIEQGYSINAVKIESAERGVDTIEDYNHLIAKYQTTG